MFYVDLCSCPEDNFLLAGRWSLMVEPRGTSLTGESDYSPSGVFACLFGLFLPIF